MALHQGDHSLPGPVVEFQRPEHSVSQFSADSGVSAILFSSMDLPQGLPISWRSIVNLKNWYSGCSSRFNVSTSNLRFHSELQFIPYARLSQAQHWKSLSRALEKLFPCPYGTAQAVMVSFSNLDLFDY